MELEEARRVRDELMGGLRSAAIQLPAQAFALGATLDPWTRIPPTTISLGISLGKGKTDHRLALLTTAPQELIIGVMAELEERAGPVELIALNAILPREASAAPDPRESLRIGSPVGHYLTRAGALGAFVRDRATGRVGILSNNHVLAATNQGQPGHRILFYAKSGTGSSLIKVAELNRYVTLKPDSEVDAAFAVLETHPDDSSDIGGRLKLSGRTTRPVKTTDVCKFGWKSKFTAGSIEYSDFPDIKVNYGSLTCTFKDLIAVRSDTSEPFSMDGDSGSLVVNDAGDAVGLIIAGGTSQDGASDYTLMCPMDRVLELLEVDLVT